MTNDRIFECTNDNPDGGEWYYHSASDSIVLLKEHYLLEPEGYLRIPGKNELYPFYMALDDFRQAMKEVGVELTYPRKGVARYLWEEGYMNTFRDFQYMKQKEKCEEWCRMKDIPLN